MAKEEKKRELAPIRYRGFPDIKRYFDRLFEDFRSSFEEEFFRPFSLIKPYEEMYFLDMPKEPLMDFADLGDHFELTAEIPGIPKDKLDIKVSNDCIEIKGEVEKAKEDKKKEYIRKERTYSSFYRKMDFPAEVVSDKATAKMENGILKITLPKKEPKEAPKMRKLEIK